MGYLTEHEHQAMSLTGQLADLMAQHVIGNGETREGDLREFVALLHPIQKMIMGQAAARAHPGLYRLLGGAALRPDDSDSPKNAARNILAAGLAVSVCGEGVRPARVKRGKASFGEAETSDS